MKFSQYSPVYETLDDFLANRAPRGHRVYPGLYAPYELHDFRLALFNGKGDIVLHSPANGKSFTVCVKIVGKTKTFFVKTRKDTI